MAFHVIPIDDLRDHEESEDCWCKPERDDVELDIYIHNSMDGREKYESGERKPH